ncbi:reverse transcriptase domain-containing protein [Tanacetum coccineum]
MIGFNLTERARAKLCDLLQHNVDVFAWTPKDMTGVPRHVAEHRLNVREGCQPIRQKKRGQATERNIAINEEVSKLMTAGIMREVHYHDWLSNPVMVKKHDDSWRMCVDFKDLNKACPKDGYPLPEIDWKVESLCGFPFKCFLDAYKGYHQIQMAEEDEEKTAFIRNQGIFYAVLSLQSPKCLKSEKIIGKLASLNRFLAKSAKKSLPFFKTLKKCTKKSDFLWTEKAESAFKQMKELIAKLPMLIAPEEKEELIIYLAASKEVVSVVLLAEREAKQMSIYFVSRALRGPEVNYTSMEKLEDLRRNTDASAKEEEPLPAQWTLFTDGSSCVDGCGAGVIHTNPEGIEFTYALRFQFKATNNEAEYEALIVGLRIAEKMGAQNLQVNVDSKLVANQVNGTYIAKETDMVKYLEKVKTLAKAFREFLINQVPRKENKNADDPDPRIPQ